jgi:hypothetical protein
MPITNYQIYKPITINVDKQTGNLYKTIPKENQEKVQLLFSFLLKEFIESDSNSLKKLMDDMSDEARAKGMTPEILEEILNEK